MLVSNIGQSSTSTESVGTTQGFNYPRAQAFSTGTDSSGYVLDSVELYIGNTPDTPDDFSVAIHRASGINPGTKLFDLSNPATFSANSVNTFTAPANTRLDSQTTYFVVVDYDSPATEGTTIGATTADAEDSTKADGWSIANDSRLYSFDTDNVEFKWIGFAGKSIRIRVNTVVSVESIAVTSTPPADQDGFYRKGDTITFQVKFTDNFEVTVTGDEVETDAFNLRLKVDVGGSEKTLSPDKGRTGVNSVFFDYTVALGDMDADGVSVPENALSLTSGTLPDEEGNAISLAHAAYEFADHKVDGSATRVKEITVTSSPPAVPGGTYYKGDTITFRVTFTDDLETDVLQGGLVRMKIDVGSVQPNRARARVGTDWLEFDHTVASGQMDTNGVSIPANALSVVANTGTFVDADGDAVALAHAAYAFPAHKVNGADRLSSCPAATGTQVWTGNLTVGSGTGVTGYDASPSHGALDDTDFTLDGTTYTIDEALYSTTSEVMSFGLTSSLANNAGLVLHVGQVHAFRLAEAGHNTITHTYNLSRTFGFMGRPRVAAINPWSDGDTVCLLLERIPNRPVTGGVGISGTARVGETLTWTNMGIADPDGQVNALASTRRQWKRVDADGESNPVDIGTGTTYKLTADDEGKRILLEFGFTDDLGYDETLTSAAFPATGTVQAAPGGVPVTGTVIWQARMGLSTSRASPQGSTPPCRAGSGA